MIPLGLKQQSMSNRINKMTAHNIRSTADELATHDLIAGRDPFCRALVKCQSRSPRSTNVYASLAAIVNSKLPDVGLLLVKRVVLDFKAGFDSKDKEKMRRASKLLAHLVNQTVVYEALAVEVMWLLLGDPTPGNVEVAVEFCMECGMVLLDCAPHMLREIFEEFRGLLKRGRHRKQEQVRVVKLLGAVRKSGFKRYPSIEDGLDLVADGDQVTHEV